MPICISKPHTSLTNVKDWKGMTPPGATFPIVDAQVSAVSVFVCVCVLFLMVCCVVLGSAYHTTIH